MAKYLLSKVLTQRVRVAVLAARGARSAARAVRCRRPARRSRASACTARARCDATGLSATIHIIVSSFTLYFTNHRHRFQYLSATT